MGVPIKRIIIFLGPYWASPVFGTTKWNGGYIGAMLQLLISILYVP